jgi:hypothetical protein
MSRTDDLIDLLKATNDILLVNEVQNVRSAYIQVDDLCELALKSFLQSTIRNWDPTDGTTAGGRPRFKGFWTVADEALAQCPSNVRLQELLGEFKDRREERNHFFHDHSLSGLTVTPEKGLDALCDLYELLDILFSDSARKVENNIILKTQMAVVRVKRETYRNGGINNRYQAILSEWTHGENSKYLPRQGVVLLRHPCVGFEFSAIYLDARGVYEALEEKGLIF